VQTRAAQEGIFLDNNRLQSKLAGADRGNVAARTATDNRHIVLSHAHSPSRSPEICFAKSEIDVDWMAVDPLAIRQACEQNLRIWEKVASVYPTPAATSRQTLNFSSHPTPPQLAQSAPVSTHSPSQYGPIFAFWPQPAPLESPPLPSCHPERSESDAFLRGRWCERVGSRSGGILFDVSIVTSSC
jgi:hypothetical protein